ncbi:MAG: PIN domain-containing protein [Candidatus Omnitrophica bacterium]|nr:PIN domain-containing protein [Candidatus Omnitrophota bacterium]MCA9417060.1 PIN domain-containing protein [Candidatus Omnitrophota bacterium]MCA9426630.1 PIN domain-containing protein [Candidatus Omnitrophota bacterium]MCA9430902.1 PIN domain-containing protein [Candidatus Omnitrophota bacterium]MCA9445214.1 PIN domain-containing protein [Candidatus Omnitrophota bacterium]
MILIDTSVWVEFFRKKGDSLVKDRLEDLITSREAAITGPVIFEILAGARPEEIGTISEVFAFCEDLEFGPDTWVLAGHLFHALREKGKTVPKSDVLIAALSLESKTPLLCRDRHFDMIREFGDRKLRVELI